MGRRARAAWEREILINGVPIERIPYKNAAIHYDDDVVRDLCGAIMCQAIRDWNIIERKKEAVIKEKGNLICRSEVVSFFNSTFCGDILSLLFAPNVDIGAAVRHMSVYPVRPMQLGWGRGDRSEETRKRLKKGECKKVSMD